MSISERTIRCLIAKSGGFCQNPNCHKDLITFFNSGKISFLKELAHIIAQKPKGPRGDEILELSQRDEYDNIIILCPTCHSLVDANPDEFSITLLKDWKQKHEDILNLMFTDLLFNTRKELRSAIDPLLRENKAIFDTYGPYCDDALNLLSDAKQHWDRFILLKIIPNNDRIESLLHKNLELLLDSEKSLLQKFKLHADAFKYNHISGNRNSAAPLFPPEMANILIGE